MSFVGKTPAYGPAVTQESLAHARQKCADAERRLAEAQAHRAQVQAEYEAMLLQAIPDGG